MKDELLWMELDKRGQLLSHEEMETGLIPVYTPFTLQAVSPTVIRVWGNLPVLGSLSVISMQPCESVVNQPLPCKSYGSFKWLKIFTSDFSTVDMLKQFCIWAYEFLTMVTEGVGHGVHKVLILLSFGVIWRHKVT